MTAIQKEICKCGKEEFSKKIISKNSFCFKRVIKSVTVVVVKVKSKSVSVYPLLIFQGLPYRQMCNNNFPIS